jgi:hypothetical protein
MRRPLHHGSFVVLGLVWLLIVGPSSAGSAHGGAFSPAMSGTGPGAQSTTTPTPVANLTAALQRTVSLLALSGSGLLAVVWARVALSWFSNDIAKKVQAKDRARDALIGTVIFLAAVSGLLWGVAHWVVTGT